MEKLLFNGGADQDSELERIQRVLLVVETAMDENYPNGVFTTAVQTLDHFRLSDT